MFKFNFGLNDEEGFNDELDVGDTDSFGNPPSTFLEGPSETHTPSPSVLKRSSEHSLDELLTDLPPAISFSPLNIHLHNGEILSLARRDLFDARFQLISSDAGDTIISVPISDEHTKTPTVVEFLDAPSDLVPGVYEGGFKTWECAIDLAECLDRTYGGNLAKTLRGKRILELGCGTAIPSLYVLHQLFSAPTQATAEETLIVLQDYNELVLRLVTLSNIVLAWYMSSSSSAFRTAAPIADFNADEEPLPPADSTQPGSLPLTQALTAAFLASLRERRITLRFFSGSWETFDVPDAGGPFDVVLTSETIYRPDCLPALVKVMRSACCTAPPRGLESPTSRIPITDAKPGEKEVPYLCLVAAKRIYFGVGGGVAEFVREVGNSGAAAASTDAKVETVWECTEGVKRIVMRVSCV